MDPLVIPRGKHPISRKMIDEEALKVLYRLHRHGFLSYLVGGSVRDLLLEKVPKDFDVATNAHPHEINALFKNSRIIGRRFRLVHVFFRGRKVVEVSTFRSRSEFEEIQTEEGEIIRTDSFGTPAEDALRRDMTVNGLFYNIADFSILDYVGGMADLERRVIRTIGDPDERFQQDPVRMIRVIRHAARTGFSIENSTYEAILRHREEIQKCSPSRLRDEFLRDLKEGAAKPSLDLMLRTGLLFSLFPGLERALGHRSLSEQRSREFFLSLFDNVDQLLKTRIQVTESVLLALFLTPFLRAVTPQHPFLGKREKYLYWAQSVHWAVHEILTPYSFPRGAKEMASQILIAQLNLKKLVKNGAIPKKLRMKKYFKEAVLLFGIEAEAKGERVSRMLQNVAPHDLLPWWRKERKETPQELRHKPHKPHDES
ncbi:MAG TPA: polynucleotide adenylyltransferase PcnB [Thermodesulfobacteriota bacterium]|nr:polynucleotide adenylyltransferase PcnB [Thermodesulfobacteriota bacterium]